MERKKSLLERRGVNLPLGQIPKGISIGEPATPPLQRTQSLLTGCMSPENRQASVYLLERRERAPSFFHESDDRSESPPRASSPVNHLVQRPLPGAFPCQRTVFFFDWDDTLCPTTWIRSLIKETRAEMEEWNEERFDYEWRNTIPGWFHQPLPDDPRIRKSISKLQRASIGLITAAQAFGVVCIVTNALPGWVDRTMQKWLPELTQYIRGHGARPPISVFYGQKEYAKLPEVQDLPFVDELAETVWWKVAAMKQAIDQLDTLYRVETETTRSMGHTRRPLNIIAVGDDEAEMQASQIVGFHGSRGVRDASCSGDGASKKVRSHSASPCLQATSSADGIDSVHGPSPWVKRMKFKAFPRISELTSQLEEVTAMIPDAICSRCHFYVDMASEVSTDATRGTRKAPAVPFPPQLGRKAARELLIQAV